jgi:AcrR family transcriptional regulator
MKRAEQKAAMEQRIKDAFTELLKKKPVDKITVTEIAQTANIDRKTFYLHYETVPDVYRQIEHGIVVSVRKMLANNDTTDWRQFIIGLNSIMKKDMTFYSVVAKKVDLTYIFDECTDIVTSILQESLLKDRQASFEDKIIIRYAAVGVTKVYADWLKSDQQIPLEQVIDALTKALNQTLANYE